MTPVADIITPEDVASYTASLTEADVAVLVAGVNAKAVRIAPCLAEDGVSAGLLAEARLILVGAVKRWAEAGSGAFSQQTIGPSSVSIDTRQRQGGYNLWPSEIDALQELCATGELGTRAFSIHPAKPADGPLHRPWCDAVMFASSCSCGAALTGWQPLYEAGTP